MRVGLAWERHISKAIHFTYPRADIDVNEVFSQRTFELAHAQMMSWRQAAGAYGNLHLHACWGEASVLARRYHGQTIATSYTMMRGFIALYERTKEIHWRMMADDVVSNVLYLQTPRGGFIHASGEFEPTYTPEQSCPIHQGMPLLALLAYAGWPAADPARRALIRPAIDAHWNWFIEHWDRRGNAWRAPLPFPGFCGVTNQDLVIVGALGRYAKIFGDSLRYEQFGRPVLEAYLDRQYYHERIGLFERGDKANFAERTSYYEIIILMLQQIHVDFPDARLPAIVDNVCAHLLDALHQGADGLTHFAWGAETDPQDKTVVRRWIRTPHTFTSYPESLHHLSAYAARQENPDVAKQCAALERTLAAYVFADGTIPAALAGDDPLFAIAARADQLWLYLIHRLGDRLRSPATVELPRIERRTATTRFLCDGRQWAIFREGTRRFAGLKSDACAVAVGAEERVAGMDLEGLEKSEIFEKLEGL